MFDFSKDIPVGCDHAGFSLKTYLSEKTFHPEDTSLVISVHFQKVASIILILLIL
jgi:hypothetical protein